MKAYKVFNSDWTCRGFQYEIGKTYHNSGKIELCSNGFHACPKVSDCFSYYSFSPDNKVAEVELFGNVINGDDGKSVASDITIVREIAWAEMLELANSGRGNSGNRNSGNRNSGNRNSGDWNSGNMNSGDWNSGNMNSGDWNSGDGNSGYFNSNEPTVIMFNKNTKLYRKDIDIPEWCYFDLTSFISYDTATDEERAEHKTDIEVCGGFLKTINYEEAWRKAWDSVDENEHNKIKQLPNFDADVFFEITGIRVKE